MKAFSILALATIAVWAMMLRAEPARDDGVLVHITHGAEDPHRLVMGLHMANLMADTGRPVLVYFDIKGVNAVLKGGKDAAYDNFPTSKNLVSILLAKKVTVMACPACLEAQKKSAQDLLPGVRVAKADTFFSFTKGRILSLTY